MLNDNFGCETFNQFALSGKSILDREGGPQKVTQMDVSGPLPAQQAAHLALRAAFQFPNPDSASTMSQSKLAETHLVDRT